MSQASWFNAIPAQDSLDLADFFPIERLFTDRSCTTFDFTYPDSIPISPYQ